MDTSPTLMSQIASFFLVIWDIIILQFKILWICLQSLGGCIFGRKEKDIKGQVVAITGAGHGFGKQLAILLAERGAHIAVIDINLENAEQVANHIKATQGVKSEAFKCDVRSFSAVKETFSRIKNSLGPVDMLINNAGITNCRPLTTLSEEDIRRTFEVNAMSHFWTLKCVLPEMMARRRGHVVSVYSSAGLAGTGNLTDYCASKIASVGLMKALEIELLDTGYNIETEINTTTICPIMMSTGMFQGCTSRFPGIFTNMDPQDSAKQAVRGILTHEPLVFIPKQFELFYRLTVPLPSRAAIAIQQFFEYRVNSHN